MLDLSKEQQQDLLHVRRLYIAKHRVLSRKRKRLAELVAKQEAVPRHNLETLLELNAAVQDITCQEFEVKYVAGVTLWCGVSNVCCFDEHIVACLQLPAAHLLFWSFNL